MPRTLPWLAAGPGKTKRESNPPATEIKCTSSPRPRVKHEVETLTKRESKRDFLKSSPSPPSSPIHRCPSEEFLIEGLDHDDIYMMVEDEFYAVAQTFTRHLHYAEFVRRKREAKDKNAAAIAGIARPTDGITPVSEVTKKRYKAEELDKRQEDGLVSVLGEREKVRGEDGGDEEEESSWAGTHLQNLILSPRRARSLFGLKGMRSSTRAAAGLAQGSGTGLGAQERDGGFDDGDDDRVRVKKGRTEPAPALLDETTDDDDDLDAGVNRSSPTIARRSVPSSSTAQRPHSMHRVSENGLDSTVRQPTTATKRGSTSSSSQLLRSSATSTRPTAETRLPRDVKKEPTTGAKVTPSNTVQAKRRLVFDDFDELPELPKPTVQSERRRSLYTNNKQKRLQDKDTGSKKSRLNEVPTFLI
ncbi:uncharacterized protein BDV17DRAFT_301379 [Aspergillus undulatus]|uniref:uncharacterized protein n=1 Tax=Aspergillus undulatus TaxID=1810928 RepID=UPI003CCD2A6B